MDSIGLPNCRNYCSPLQALYWLIQDEKLEISGLLLGLSIVKGTDNKGHGFPLLLSIPHTPADGQILSEFQPHYTLKKLLDAAWSGEPKLMYGKNLQKIIEGIHPKAEAEEYALLVRRHDDLHLQSAIMDDFLRKKEIFNIDDRNTIAIAIQQSRWKLFYTVADRLNSPELISYFINKYFFFRKTPASGVYFTFFNKKAQCTDAAYFAQFMLKRAGYKTFIRSVKWDRDPWDGLHTGAGIILDNGSYLLVSSYTGINSLAGPYENLDRLDQQLSCGNKIIDSQWGAYYPPCYY
jgi:hypothetical protein